MDFFPRGNVDCTQVMFFINASYSTFMTTSHLGFSLASSNVIGSNTYKTPEVREKFTFSLPCTNWFF
jgi:hypothetical protein